MIDADDCGVVGGMKIMDSANSKSSFSFSL
jgi:hypothetical protein